VLLKTPDIAEALAKERALQMASPSICDNAFFTLHSHLGGELNLSGSKASYRQS
jgi:hypothetical protein